MKGKKRVACFFTAGYTELNAMKLFMKKINNNVEYIQLCPSGPRKNKNAIINRHITITSRDIDTVPTNQSGLTGEALMKYVVDFVGGDRFGDECYDAILIEDDKDDRFLCVQPDGTARIDEEKWACFTRESTEKLHAKCPNIPVLFFLASPEVEAWLLSDWDNSFGKAYRDIFTTPQNNCFGVKFRKYINDTILTPRYRSCIEAYGYFDNEYKKLSEELQNALAQIDFLDGFQPALDHRFASYSKKIEGAAMLAEIDPKIVMRHCRTFFKSGFFALQAL